MTDAKKHRVVWVENDDKEISYTESGSKEIKFATWAHKEEKPDSTKFIEYSAVEELKAENEVLRKYVQRCDDTDCYGLSAEIAQLKADLKIAVDALKHIRPAIDYAYEDRADQYYLNVKKGLDIALSKIETKV